MRRGDKKRKKSVRSFHRGRPQGFDIGRGLLKVAIRTDTSSPITRPQVDSAGPRWHASPLTVASSLCRFLQQRDLSLLHAYSQRGGYALGCPWLPSGLPKEPRQGPRHFQNTSLWEEGKSFGLLINFLCCRKANNCPEMPGPVPKGP